MYHKTLNAATLFFSCFIFCAAALMPAVASANGGNATILPFSDASGKNLGAFVTDTLAAQLTQNGLFRLVDRDKLKAIVDGKKTTDLAATLSVSKRTGAAYTITGNVDTANMEKLDILFGSQYTATVRISVKIIDNTTGEILAMESAEGSDEAVQLKRVSRDKADFKAAAEDAVTNLTAKLKRAYPLSGKVAHRKGSDIYINLGSESGVKPGDRFTVYEEGETIRDPDTGQIIARQKTKIAALRITRVEAKAAIGICDANSQRVKIGQLARRET